jgi:hypothetical protein
MPLVTKYTCKVCGAKSGQQGFGEEKTRSKGGSPGKYSQDPEIVKRRLRASQIRKTNKARSQ